MEDGLIVRGSGRPKKTIVQTIKKDVEANGLSLDLVHDRTI